MKPLKTVGQAVERLKDRKDLRRAYIHWAAHATGARKERIERDLASVETTIHDLRATRLALV